MNGNDTNKGKGLWKVVLSAHVRSVLSSVSFILPCILRSLQARLMNKLFDVELGPLVSSSIL